MSIIICKNMKNFLFSLVLMANFGCSKLSFSGKTSENSTAGTQRDSIDSNLVVCEINSRFQFSLPPGVDLNNPFSASVPTATSTILGGSNCSGSTVGDTATLVSSTLFDRVANEIRLNGGFSAQDILQVNGNQLSGSSSVQCEMGKLVESGFVSGQVDNAGKKIILNLKYIRSSESC